MKLPIVVLMLVASISGAIVAEGTLNPAEASYVDNNMNIFGNEGHLLKIVDDNGTNVCAVKFPGVEFYLSPDDNAVGLILFFMSAAEAWDLLSADFVFAICIYDDIAFFLSSEECMELKEMADSYLSWEEMLQQQLEYLDGHMSRISLSELDDAYNF